MSMEKRDSRQNGRFFSRYILNLLIAILIFIGATPAAADVVLTDEEKAWLKQHKKIRVANEDDWPPFDFSVKGEAQGISMDYIRLIARKTGMDIEFINWAGVNGIPIAIVFTKADKLSKNKVSGSVSHFLNQLKKYWEKFPPIFITSSKSRRGREDILEYIFNINKSLNS